MTVEKKILIVEHEVAVAEGLARRMRGRGYTPVIEARPDEAAALFERARPELVIISLTLPADAGRLLCRAIRRKPLGTLVPILFLGTGEEAVASVNDAIAAGADHWFKKPEGIDALLTKVAIYIGPGTAQPPEPSPIPHDGARAMAQALGADPSPAAQPPASEAARPDEGDAALWDSVSEALSSPPPQGSADQAPRPRLHLTTEEPPRPPEIQPPPRAGRRNLPRTAPIRPLSPGQLDPGVSDPGPGVAGAFDDPRDSGQFQAASPSPAPAESGPFDSSPFESGQFEAARRIPDRPTGPQLTPPTLRGGEQGDWRGQSAPPSPPEPAPLPHLQPGPGSWVPPERPNAEGPQLPPLDLGRAVPLSQRGVAEILASAAYGALSGRVELAAAGVLRRVFLEGGRPVYIDTSDPQDDLAGYLAHEGMLDRATLRQIRAEATRRQVAAEEILMEAGVLRPEEIYDALRGYVTDRVMSLFALESGEAVIIRGGGGALDPVDLGVPPGRLILDGVRRKYGRLRLFRVFGTTTMIPKAHSRPLPSGLSLRPEEEAVYAAVDGRRTLSEIARHAGVSEVDALAIAYALSTLGVLAAGPGGRRPGHLPPLSAEAVGRLGAPRTAEQMPGFSEAVESRHQAVRDGDYYAVLGLPHNATPGEIHAAWEKLKRQFDPHRIRKDGPFWAAVQEIAEVVDDAYAMLADGRRRALYDRHLAEAQGRQDDLNTSR